MTDYFIDKKECTIGGVQATIERFSSKEPESIINDSLGTIRGILVGSYPNYQDAANSALKTRQDNDLLPVWLFPENGEYKVVQEVADGRHNPL